MGSKNVFDLNIAIAEWQNSNLKNNGLTPEDENEFMDHFYLGIEELRRKGLNDAEAFAVTKFRLGGSEYWAGAMRELNEENYIAKKTLNLFYGVLIYYIVYNLFFIVTTGIFLLDYITKRNYQITMGYFQHILKWSYLFPIVAVFIIFLFRKKISSALHSAKYKLSRVIVTFLVFINLLLFKDLLNSKAQDIFSVYPDSVVDVYANFYLNFERFRYWFPMLIIFCFLFLYLFLKRSKYV